ncbi:succinylglutamate desuccinylase [Halostella sp. JP-L12]|uniref:succinylglutamate desuccinylase/aspartoacylase domain-containing protein n=1 Tax=Halostella TaxID=1843185 RepID=UPI000EF7B25C|nr:MULTISPECIES: succinylglutamate desuccinylase/aspartoacylase family protein [Halostella]NHN48462.1 succinylglutamate desuccinylase [Halostella sp. JP-L12]
MRVEQVGDGTPEIAVVAGIHGDELGGVRAVERLLDEPLTVDRPVKFIIANEEAIEAGERYLEADLNRSFPGDPDADEHERRLAAAIAEEIEGCLTLALHSTQSYAEPFAVVDGIDDMAREICPQLSVAAVVETSEYIQGRIFVAADAIEIETGLQGSDQSEENALRIVREFLTATGVLPGDTVRRELPAYKLLRPINKEPADEYEVFAENFERVAAGERFAAADGDPLTAEDDFYPVLLSPYGYTNVFGYAAEKIDTL